MHNRTWACVGCGKSYRRARAVVALSCAICGQACEDVHWKIRIPKSRPRRQWLEFWEKYRTEKKLLAEFQRNPKIKRIRLEIHSQIWMRP